MPKVQFFDFTNRPTYLFFRWVRDGGRQDPATLIRAAFDAIEQEDGYQIDGDVSLGTRDALEKMLYAALGDFAGDFGEPGFMDAALESVGAREDWLSAVLVADAVERIDCQAVAVALLIDAGKWAPDNTIPECE
jgi:hypothetical protein